MILFYTDRIDGNHAFLDEEEARHCGQVLRKKPGDLVRFVDGQGGWYEGVLTDVRKKECRIAIQEARPAYEPFTTGLHIAIAPTKNSSRLEWFLEKATEIGITDISLIICQHSERRKVRTDRLRKIVVAAMKQSLRARLPRLHDPVPFNSFVRQFATDGQRYIARGDQNVSLKDNYPPGTDVLILIGPEGDFSPTELELATQHGFRGVHLGPHRLRTETAGLVACHTIQLLNQSS